MYNEEIKCKIIHLLEYKTINEIAEEFDISYSTLYRWQKSKKDSELIKKLMLEKKYEEALVIGKSYPNNEVIKGQVMSIYMKKKDYAKAMQIAREFPNNAPIQGRLMSIHMENKDYEKAIKIAEKFPNNAPIQRRLIKIYMKNGEYGAVIEIAKRFPNNVLIQNQLMTKNKNYEKQREIAKKNLNDTQIQSRLIKTYMKKKNYESAIGVAKKFPNDIPIQSQLIKIYMENGEYEAVIEIAKRFPNSFLIQNQLMTVYMKNKDYEKALEIAEKFSSYSPIQNQLMAFYIKNEDYESAIKIAEKFSNYPPIQSQLMTVYMKNEDYESAIKIAEKFPNDTSIQSQLMTVYMENKDYEAAIKIAEKFSNSAPIQSQLMTIYMKKEDYESAIKIAEKFSSSVPIQGQLMTVYMKNGDYESAIKIAEKFPNDNIIQSRLMKIYTENEIKENSEEISDWYNDVIQTEKQKFPTKILEIRNKIVVGNISVKDLDTLESFKEKIEEEKYLLIKLAMYEKLGLLNLGMKQLKQNTIFSDKLKKQLLMQFERKSKFYNLGNWDSLIGWFDETKPLEKVQEACVKENDVASGNPSTSIPEVQSKNIEPSRIQKTIPKKQNNPKSIFKTNIGITNTVPSKVKEEQKKPTKIKNNQGPKTLYDTLNQTYKKMILNLKIKYYKDMHDEEKKQSALYKYDRLEESLSSKPSIKNFDILLLMLIGDGDGSLDIEQSIPKEYNGEYKKVLNKINSRRKH